MSSYKYGDVQLAPMQETQDTTQFGFKPEIGTVFKHVKNGVETPVILITQEQFLKWHNATKEISTYKDTVKQDVTAVITEIDNLIKAVKEEPLKIVSKLGMALARKKDIDLPGVNFEKISEIGKKYAPEVMARFEPKDEKQR